MFLETYFLKKSTIRSAATRNVFFFFNNINFYRKIRSLSIGSKWKAGRNESGKIVFRTRTSLTIKNKNIKANFNLRYFKLGFLGSFTFVPFKNKLLSLIYYSNGSFTYYLSTEHHKLFSLIFYNFHKKLKKLKIKNIFFMLFQIKKLSFVSVLELLPGLGAQYARSPGTKARIIKFDLINHSVLIKLPSGVRKIFSYYSFVMFGQLALNDNKNFINGKAGYWKSFGIKSLVRGVAMNPVDHPHGGRTKSVKYPRTPWGKTTKFK